MGAGLGGGFLVEAVVAACYIRNRCPDAGLSKTPDELWSGKVPSVKHLRAYGSKAYVSLEEMKRKRKMGVTKWEGVVVGYPSTIVGYRVWDPVRGKVFNVGVPFVDEDVKPQWWRKVVDGGAVEEVEEFIFPDLDVDSSQQQVHQGGEHIAAADGVVEPPIPSNWWKTVVTMRTMARVRGGMMTSGDQRTMLWRTSM